MRFLKRVAVSLRNVLFLHLCRVFTGLSMGFTVFFIMLPKFFIMLPKFFIIMTKSLPRHCLQIQRDKKSSRTTERPMTLDGSDLRP